MRATKWISAMVFGATLLWVGMAMAEDAGDKPAGPPKSMKLLEVFPSQNYTVVSIKFFDAKGKVTKVSSGTFAYWSNFLLDKRAPAKKRKIDVSQASYHLGKYTLKLPGFKRLCPPRVARLTITFTSKSPRLRFRKKWTKKAQCH